MESASIDLYEVWGKAQDAIRGILQGDGEEVNILDTVEFRDGEVKLRGRKSLETLRKFRSVLKMCLDLLEQVLKKRVEIINRTREGKVEGGTSEEVISRLNYIDKLYGLCNETHRLIESIAEGNLEPILDPKLFHLLRSLLDMCTKGLPAPPIRVTTRITWTI